MPSASSSCVLGWKYDQDGRLRICCPLIISIKDTVLGKLFLQMQLRSISRLLNYTNNVEKTSLKKRSVANECSAFSLCMHAKLGF